MSRIALLFLLVAAPVAAQSGWLQVSADAGEVWVDGAESGMVGEWIAVEPGARQLALVESGVWNPRRSVTETAVVAGDSVTVEMALPYRVRVETMPIRAVIVRTHADGIQETLGTAPLTLDLAPGERAQLAATLDGYLPATVEARGPEPVTILLTPAPGSQPDVALLPTERSTASRTLIDVGIGAATLVAGAVAVHYKFRADAVDDRYRGLDPVDRGDEDLRQEALRLDRFSAAALVGMQVGVGALALRFVLR